MKTDVTISKCNPFGKEVFRYQGKVLKRETNCVLLEAHFGLENIIIVDVPLSVGDIFLETYFSDRWFNIYEIHSKGDSRLKGWYCNISYPAKITDQQITFRDLALDLFVFPDGRQVVLDEHEFVALDLSTEDREQAKVAMAALQRLGPAAFALK